MALTELGAREVGKDAEGAGLACPWPWSPVLGVLHQPLLAGIGDQRSERLSVGRVWLRTSKWEWVVGAAFPEFGISGSW